MNKTLTKIEMKLAYYTRIKSRYPVLCTIIQRMFYCSMIAMLLNPTSWLFLSTPITIVTDPHFLAFCFCFAMLYMIPYLVIGSAVWYSLRKRAWSVQTMAICLSVNIVILSVILLFVYKTMMSSDNGPKCLSPVVFIIPVASVVGSLLSVFSISYFCIHFHQKLTQMHLSDEDEVRVHQNN